MGSDPTRVTPVRQGGGRRRVSGAPWVQAAGSPGSGPVARGAEHTGSRLLDAGGALERPVAVVADELLRDVDDPARARDEVGDEEHVARRQLLGGAVAAQLIVRCTHDGAAPQAR